MSKRKLSLCDDYYITDEEKIVGRIMFPKIKTKRSSLEQLSAVRLLICVIPFIIKLIQAGMDIVCESIIEYLTLTELATLSIVCFRLGHKDILNFLKQRCKKKTLMKVFFNNEISSSYGTYTTTFENLNLDKILSTERNLINLSRSLSLSKNLLKIDTIVLPFGETIDENIMQVEFNPCFDLITFISEKSFKVMCFGGKCRAKYGAQLYQELMQNNSFLSLTWSPDGTHLIVGKKDFENIDYGILNIYRYNEKFCNFKMLKTTTIEFSWHYSSKHFWTGNKCFQVLDVAGNINKYEIETKIIKKKTIFLNFSEKVDKHAFIHHKLLFKHLNFGCVTFSTKNPNLLGFMKQCNKKHEHDKIVLVNLDSTTTFTVIATIFVPGFVLSFEFSLENELWIMWSENNRESWCLNTCLVQKDSFSACLFNSKTCWLSNDEYSTRGPSKIGLGYYSLSDEVFYLNNAISDEPIEHFFNIMEYFNFKRSANFHTERCYETAYVKRMQINTHFIAINLFIGCFSDQLERKAFRV